MNKISYNKFELLPQIPYKILEKLMLDTSNSGEMIWKLLKYSDNEAYNKPNLQLKDKSAMIFNGIGVIDNFNVFLDPYDDDVTVQEKVFLRIYTGNTYPEDRVKSVIEIVIEVYCHPKLCVLKNYQSRIDTIIQCLLEILNGEFTGQIGQIYFDNTTRVNSRIQIMGTRPYKGKFFILGARI